MRKICVFIQVLIIAGIVSLFALGFSGINKPGNHDLTSNIRNRSNKSEISKIITDKEKQNKFDVINLFNYEKTKDDKSNLNNFLNYAVLLELNQKQLKNVLRDKKDDIELLIPVSENHSLDLMLTRVSIMSKDFSIISKSNDQVNADKVDEGLHYRGIIKGDNNSWAAVSFFDDFVMGLAASGSGNYVLGSVKNKNNEYSNNYVLYNDRDILKKMNFKCGDGDMEDDFVRNYKSASLKNNNTGDYSSVDTVEIYFETDYQMYEDNNGNLNQLANYVMGIFNQVAALYQNEQLPIKISQIGYWNHSDPYANDTDSYTILQRFGYNKKDDFEGDLAHLLSTGHNQELGGIAWINVLCTPYNENDYSGRFAFSNIEDNYNPYPVYSWTVTVVAHEMGHNFGSYHTHACHWHIPPSGIGALDSCYYAEGNCYLFPQPNYNGTLMSYCHLNGATNLANGFGRPFNSYWSQPGDTVRMWYQAASCLHYETNSSEQPVAYNLLQNYPNPFNPSTHIKYVLPEEGFVTLTLYDITGKEVARLINNKFFGTGIYSYLLDANIYKMSSGVYLYKLSVVRDGKDTYSEIKKMVLIK